MNSFVVSSRVHGKSLVKALRNNGFVPCTLQNGSECISYSICFKSVVRALMERGFFNRSFELIDENGSKICDALAREVQYHPIQGYPLHVNFVKLFPDRMVVLEVPLVFKNMEKAPGIKQGGVIKIHKNVLKLKVLGNNLVSHIDVDLHAMNVAEAITVGDIALPSGADFVLPSGADSLVQKSLSEKVAYMKMPRRE
ncbi:hypothetical protein [Candidatus Gromoviella agglomerans]|uniref:hypothetical protein n=1 Tax=Candidatus Gromoviella agglomerans TaxID=2806609 RepID=UPI001E3FC406|nr:hypothetical protein [Candidatus Gromoviella agglomerans]UFX98230.1 50S ribosomal protein L25 [Candidatus Gromoviella agglomerans]